MTIRRAVGRVWSRIAPAVARFRPDIWTEDQWLGRSEDYWREGWKDDPRGSVNAPAAYWAEGNEHGSYTPDLLQCLKGWPGGPVSVLEIGCNAGRNLFHIGRQYPETALAGIELNPEAIRFAREHAPGASNWDLRVGDLTDSATLGTFPDAHFDLVFSMAVLVHLPPGGHKQRILRECWRICRRGLLLIEPHTSGHQVWNTTTDRRMSPFSVDDYTRYLPGQSPLVSLTHRGAQDPYRVLFFRRSPDQSAS